MLTYADVCQRVPRPTAATEATTAAHANATVDAGNLRSKVSEEGAAERTKTRRIVAADKERASRRYAVYLLYRYKSTNSGAHHIAPHRRCGQGARLKEVRSLLALLVQKYKY
jgi:hypothetical protein